MNFSESLKKNRDFQIVYRGGTSKANRYLVMYVRENQSERNRIGISVSKKVGNSVVRHHLTRLIREAYRLKESSFHRGWDIVVVARASSKNCTQQKISESVYDLAGKHRILEDQEKDES